MRVLHMNTAQIKRTLRQVNHRLAKTRLKPNTQVAYISIEELEKIAATLRYLVDYLDETAEERSIMLLNHKENYK